MAAARRGCACEHQQAEAEEEQDKEKRDPSPGGEGLLLFGSQSVSEVKSDNEENPE